MLRIILIVIALVALTLGIVGYRMVFAPNVPATLEQKIVQIPANTSFENLVQLLNQGGQVASETSFRLTAQAMRFDKQTIRSGRFEIKERWSNHQLIRHLQIGSQAPIKLTFNNKRTIEELCGHLSNYLILDSLQLVQYFTNDDSLQKIGYSYESIMSLFIPNTYELYWNTDLSAFVRRMQKENSRFWASNNRENRLKELKMSKLEVYALASIVDKETNVKAEKPRVAGVYLNRLQKGMALQADPTVIFATRDFEARRVLNRHLEFDSPYNTYMYAGLPPGPISMSSISGIDAVLQAETHDYYYFCAEPGYEGSHVFAKTLAAHNKNANIYRRWLNTQNIRR